MADSAEMSSPQAFEESDVRAAVIFGQEDVVAQWVEANSDNPASVTRDVLFPAALYGQMKILKAHIDKGDLTLRDSGKDYHGWTLYHFAVYGYIMNCSYLFGMEELAESSDKSDPSLPKTRDAAMELQLDIIHMIAQAGAPLATSPSHTSLSGSTKGAPPPSLLALKPEINFIEAAFLLDILSVELSNGPVSTPGLDQLSIPTNAQHRQALVHVVEWAYLRSHRAVLAYCHEYYLNLCSDSIKIGLSQLPLFLDAVVNERVDIISLILELKNKRPIPDSIVSRPFQLASGRRVSALSLCCEKCCHGMPNGLTFLLSCSSLGTFLRDISLSEMAVGLLPAQLFHRHLHSLNVSHNDLTGLPSIDLWDCPGLSVLDLSENRFTVLPAGLFSLPKLRKLDISDNQITSLDVSMWTAPSLEWLVASRNKLTSLPCPAKSKQDEENKPKEESGFSRHYHTALDLAGSIHSIRHRFVDLEAEREEDYHKTQSGYNLELLDLGENQFTCIPSGLPCLAPLLLTLKMSRNRIKDLGHVGDYPTLLKSLHLQGNQAEKGIRPSKRSQTVCLQHPSSQAKWCSHSDHLRLVNLQFLDLSNNMLSRITLEIEPNVPSSPHGGKTKSFIEATMSSSPLSVSTLSGLPSVSKTEEMIVLYPKLQTLLIKRNRLDVVPSGLHKLERLCSLDLSSNKNIQNLPLNIHQLKNLYSFQYKEIQDPIIHELDKCQSVGEILYYLRARETEAITNSSMRLFLIGHYHKGKTSLLRALQGKRPKTAERISGFHARTGTLDPETVPEKESTVGIECDKWVCTSKKRAGAKIIFYTWDFAGQEEYYQTHQCFLTSRALYLLVWNVTDGYKGIVDGMGVWLRTLQARAPGANVIIVGTHLDELRRKAGGNKQVDALLHKYEEEITQEYVAVSKTSPVIRSVNFVAVPDRLFGLANIDTLVESIYDVASNMEVPRTHDMPASLHIKILDEKIPRSYVRLEEYITNHALYRNIMKRDEFCELADVKHIIPDANEVDAAINFLHNNVGTVLHFERPLLTDYYILNPQWWFDACALVVAPNNISTLVKHGAASSSGLLKIERMVKEFVKKGYNSFHVQLVLYFLMEFGIIMTIDAETALMPSMIQITPQSKLCDEPGAFPYGNFSVEEHNVLLACMTSYLPTAMSKSVCASIKVKRTGLILRRMFLLPPLPSGFWSKLICLCLQKEDFLQIISRMCDPQVLPLGGHGLRRMIGNMELEWTFWKTGIVLSLDGSMVLRINSLYEDEYQDPSLRAPISETKMKIGRFQFVDEGGQLVPLDPRFSDVIEVIVPEVELLMEGRCDSTVSTKLLAKALEILDEVLKGHCEPLAEDGIYSMDEMCHVVPCPVCFGDKDNRMKRPPLVRKSEQGSHPLHPRLASRLRSRTSSSQGLPMVKPSQGVNNPVQKCDVIIIFAIDQCIQRSTVSEFIICPAHNNQEISLECLVPDIVFKDLLDLKLKRNSLIDPPGSDGSPIGSGCFGVVYHKILVANVQGKEMCSDVAVKTFRGSEIDYDTHTEVVKMYADMRYELNKLSVLDHDYVVKFVGLLPNPWSFILEWAPLMSLEKLRSKHEQNMRHFCPSSLFVVLMQVADGLAYLHDPIGIVHNDLKLSNILAYDFPPVDHVCCTSEEDRGRCVLALPEKGLTRVKVKLGDMGVCANPTGQHSNNHLGVKRFAPECIVFETRLTEKVDVFCLALCLYELMTLRSIPPRGMSEPDYTSMIRKNKRPPFHSRDPRYSLALYLSLEQCWMQEHNKRPSAKMLRAYLETVSGVSVSKSFEVSSRTMHHLLDSYPVSSEGKTSSLYVLPNQESLSFCLGVLEGNTSRVMLTEYVSDGSGNHSILKTRVMHQTKHNVVVAVYVTQAHDFFIGYCSGRVIVLESSNAVPYNVPKCGDSSQNDYLEFLHYVEDQRLLLLGYKSGHVHVTKLSLGAEKQAFVKGRYCCTLAEHQSPVRCFSLLYQQSERFELWCGCIENKIEVIAFPPQGAKVLTRSSFPPSSCTLDLNNPTFNSLSSAVTSMVTSRNMEVVFVLICDSLHSRAFCLLDVVTKDTLRFIHCQPNVSCFNLTPSHFLIGTEDGEVMVHSLAPLMRGESHSIFPKECVTVSSHKGPVSHLLLLDGCILQDGFTSLFPTYLGRQSADIPCQCLITVGEGLQEFGQDSRNFVHKLGSQSCNINIWMI